MTAKTKARFLLTVAAFGAATAGVWAWTGDDVKWEQVPAAVQNVLTRLAGGADFTEIEKERERGGDVYSAEWKVNGLEHEATVTAAGVLVEMEQELAPADVPASLQAAIAKAFPTATGVTWEKETKIKYEATVTVDGKKREVAVSPHGHVRTGHDGGDDDGDDDDGDDGDK